MVIFKICLQKNSQVGSQILQEQLIKSKVNLTAQKTWETQDDVSYESNAISGGDEGEMREYVYTHSSDGHKLYCPTAGSRVNEML